MRILTRRRGHQFIIKSLLVHEGTQNMFPGAQTEKASFTPTPPNFLLKIQSECPSCKKLSELRKEGVQHLEQISL